MEELRAIFAANLIRLRTQAGITQAELAAQIHYSDKSVSKWERAEGLPDAYVLKQLSLIFHVSVDDLLSEGVTWCAETEVTQDEKHDFNKQAVTAVAFLGIWTLSVLMFVLFWIILDQAFWIIPLCTVPISLVTLLVLSCIWHGNRWNQWIVCGIVFAAFAIIAFFLREHRPWQLTLVLVPAEFLVLLGYRIRLRSK